MLGFVSGRNIAKYVFFSCLKAQIVGMTPQKWMSHTDTPYLPSGHAFILYPSMH